MDLKEIEALIKIREHLHMVTNNINVGIDRTQEAKLRKNVLPSLDKAIVMQCLTPEFSQILKDILDPPVPAKQAEPIEQVSQPLVEEKPVLVGGEISERKPLTSFKTKKEPKNLTLLREKLISDLGVADVKPAEEKKES